LTARRDVGQNNKVLHSELVPEITNEPNYDAALGALNSERGVQVRTQMRLLQSGRWKL
jgi:hypothetical protein